MRVALIVLASMMLLLAAAARAEVGDPTIRTDHPQYAGEGAFQTVEDCARFAAGGAQSPQDKAIAMYLWLLTHQWHLASPQEFGLPSAKPDTQNSDAYELMVFDANRARFSYGYGLCGTVHAWNEPYWKALGMNARRRAFPGHTNSEIEYDGAWHAFDTDMAGLIFRPEGVVAGYADVVKDPKLATSAKPPLPCYPFAWPGDFQTMQRGWREVAKGGHWYPMYHAGYAAHPGVVHLRSGETFTRYFDRDHFGGPSQRRFWHHQPGGPFRDWTFANQGLPQHDGAKSNSRGNASYCNGEFVYRPILRSAAFREGVVAASDNLAHGHESPRLRAKDGGVASVTFSHFSPYVICGDPADDANPMTGPATGGLFVSGQAIGSVQLAISADNGQTWQSAGEVGGKFERDLTDLVKGRYGWHARFEWQGKGGLDQLQFTTVTQVCQTIYPRLKPGGTTTTYRAASQAVVPVLPNLGLPEDEATRYEEKSLRSPNVVFSPRSSQSRFAYQTTNNKPGVVVFRIDAPTELTEVSAAVRFGVRVPPPAGCDYRLDLSLDGGQTWSPLAKADIPPDNEYSSGWMFGRRAIDGAGSKSALIRAHFYNGGYLAGLIDLQLYGLRRTVWPQDASLTYGWKEDGQPREFTQALAAGTDEKTFVIPTGSAVVDEFVRIAVPD
jgi:hypothetical protein